jgi:outer membrane protein OmpA-like peptidoglycan-associated protein
MAFRKAILAVGLLGMPIAAHAQPISGLYLGAGAGVNFMQNETDKSIDGVVTPGKELELGTGAAAVGAVGWGFGNGLRTELEFDYRYNSLEEAINPAPERNGQLSGSEQKYGPMVNVLYDFNGLSAVVVPYAGVGVGYQWADVSAGYTHTATGTAGSFAYQAIVGAAFPIAPVPGLAVTAEYRFMGLAGDRTYTGEGVTAVRTDDFNHSILFGIRYTFGTPAPAIQAAPSAAPTPAVQPARSYLVFFDWDKASLTDRARQIIKEAADNSTHVQYTRIEVNGYTDTSGTPQYNMGLSIRRANAVEAELIKDGVPAAAITTQGFGETHLLVPTGSGVREPQNRRVEIVIH